MVALHLVDPRERALPVAGMVTLWDPETDQWRRIDTEAPAVRAYFAERAEAFDRDLAQGFREQNVDLLRLETGQPYAEPLLTFFRRRERMLWR